VSGERVTKPPRLRHIGSATGIFRPDACNDYKLHSFCNVDDHPVVLAVNQVQ